MGIIAMTMIVEMTTTMTTIMWQECEVWASSLMPLGAVVVEKERRRIVCVCVCKTSGYGGCPVRHAIPIASVPPNYVPSIP